MPFEGIVDDLIQPWRAPIENPAAFAELATRDGGRMQ
jgi:hypothetical protein